MNPELVFHLKSLTRLLYFVTEEEDRFLIQLQEALRDKASDVKVWSSTLGLHPLNNVIQDWSSKAHKEDKTTMSIHEALTAIYKEPTPKERKFYVILDPERWLKDPQVQRRFLSILHQCHNNIEAVKGIICVSNTAMVPSKLSRYTEVVYDNGLTVEEIQELVSGTCTNLRMDTPEEPEKLLRGLTSFEIQSALIQTFKKTNGNADPRILSDYRLRQLKKTNLIKLVDVSKFDFEQVGGLDRLKSWVSKASAAWTPAGQEFGLRPPKGVLAVGIWGCGKSLSVKCLGKAWDLPVIQLDLGRLRSSGVGDSEENTYRVTRLVESAAPCVTGDTLVTLADGSVVPIQELWEDPPEDLQVMCWNDATLRAEITKVTHVTRRSAEVFKLTAFHGYELKSTGNHQHYVMRGGMPEWVRTDELLPGDMLAVSTYAYPGNADCTTSHPKGMRPYSEGGRTELRRGGGGYRDAIVPKLPSEWSTDLGWIIGMIEGDGYLGKRGAIGVISSSEEILDKADRIREVLFGLKSVRYETTAPEGVIPNLPGLSENPQFKRVWDSKVQNQLTAEFLKNARDAILTAPLQVRAAFLAGWIDADGCIEPERITLTVKCPNFGSERRILARQIIQSLGVVPSKFEGTNLEITGSRAVKLSQLIYEHLTIKAEKAFHVSSSDIGFDRGMGFACGLVLKEARRLSGKKHKELPVSTVTGWAYETGNVPVSERHLKNYASWLENSALKSLLDADCRWVKIKNVEPIGVDVVYDLACEGEHTHSFIANGLITHNCILWIDEAEKSLSGGASSAYTDAGTTSRMIGALSTWIQETDAPVCLALTANSCKTLPVEFVNRMDVRWFFDLPSKEDRIDILKIHLEKRGQDPSKFNLAELSEAAKDTVGREIEQCITEAMMESFSQDKKGLDEGILLKELRSKPRIVRTMTDEIQETLDWVGYDPQVDDGIRARFAADPKGQDKKLKLG